MVAPIVAVTDAPFPDFQSAELALAALGAEIRHAAEPSPDAIAEVGAEAVAVMVTYAQLSASTLSRLRHCRVVARMGIGLDNIDLQAATQLGIVVTNVPDYCIDEVSDQALALLLAVARRIPQGNALVHFGGWSVAGLGPMHRIRGQVLGLMGFGKIARALTGKAQALGMEVIAYDPYVPAEACRQLKVRLLRFEEVLVAADVVSIHIPLTAETHHLFGADAFARMKRGATVINTARGALVDEHALAAAISSGHLAGAALDVLTNEPPLPDSALLDVPNLILTPHTAYYSEESTAELQRKAAEDVARILTGESPRYPANPEVLESPALRR